MLVTRPQALACSLLVPLAAPRERRFWLGMAVGFAPLVASILVYDWALTGSPLLLPWELFGKEHYGFGHPVPDELPGYEHTPARALQNLIVTFVRLNGWALGWPLSLAAPVAWLALRRPAAPAVLPWALAALGTALFQFFYYSNGASETGAVYYQTALPFFAVAGGAALASAPPRWRAIALASAMVGTPSFFVEHGARLVRLTHAVAEPFRSLEVPHPALVIVESDYVGHLPVGWVGGVPFRSRRPEAPVVFYPRGSHRTLDATRAIWPERPCFYRYYDRAAARHGLVSCDRIGQVMRGFDFGPTDAQLRITEGERLAARRWADGRWRGAFPWLRWIAPWLPYVPPPTTPPGLIDH
jgi:hypothetical protein